MKLFHKIAITTLGIAMATAVGAGITRYNRSDVKMAKADVQPNNKFWTEVTALNELNATDYYTIATADGNNFLNGSVSSGHFSSTAYAAAAPSGTSAAGVFQLVNRGTNIWSIKLTATNKFVTASAAASGNANVGSASDSDGWRFKVTGTDANKFDATFQKKDSNNKYAGLRSYSNSTFRTYSAGTSATGTASSGDRFRIYKYVAPSLSLMVDPSSAIIPVAGTQELTATTIGGSGDVTWTTSNDAIASISSDTGTSITVTGESVGTATITASYDAADPVEVTIEVFEISGSGTQLDPYTASDIFYLASQLPVGDNNGAVVYATGTIAAVTSYTESNHRATFTITDGVKTITAYSINDCSDVLTDSNYVGAKCEVLVSGAIINHATSGAEIGYGGTAALSASLVSSSKGGLQTVAAALKTDVHAVGSVLQASDFTVTLNYATGVSGSITSGFTWIVNGGADNSPLIEGVNTIVVTYGGVDSENIELELTLVHAESIEFNTDSVTLLIGDTFQLEATILPAGYVDEVSWTSDDAGIAEVSDSGLVTAVAAGFANITATVNGHSAVCNVEVQSAVKYSKITSLPDGAELSGQYVIVCESANVYMNGSLGTLDAINNGKARTISGAQADVLSTEIVTIAAVEGGYSIRSASGYYIGQTSDSNGLVQSNSEAYVNTITFDANGNADIVSSSAHLRFNNTAGQKRFRYYKSSGYTGQMTIQLYKLDVLQSWIQTYMHMNDGDYEGDGTGLCNSAGTYLAAKGGLAALGKLHIAQFKDGVQDAYSDALARYEAWAAACGDATPFDGRTDIANGTQSISMRMNNNGINAVIIVSSIIASISLAGVFFMLRKRRHQ